LAESLSALLESVATRLREAADIDPPAERSCSASPEMESPFRSGADDEEQGDRGEAKEPEEQNAARQTAGGSQGSH
jgi:hypothetical protein